MSHRVLSKDKHERSSNIDKNHSTQDEISVQKTKKCQKSRKTDKTRKCVLEEDTQNLLDKKPSRHISAEKHSENINLSKCKRNDKINDHSQQESRININSIQQQSHKGRLEHQTTDYVHAERVTNVRTKKQLVEKQQMVPEKIHHSHNSELNHHERSMFQTQQFNSTKDFFVGSQNSSKPLRTSNKCSPFKITKSHREWGRDKNSFMNDRNHTKRRFVTDDRGTLRIRRSSQNHSQLEFKREIEQDNNRKYARRRTFSPDHSSIRYDEIRSNHRHRHLNYDDGYILEAHQGHVSSRRAATKIKRSSCLNRSHSRKISLNNSYKQPFQHELSFHSQNYTSPFSKQKKIRYRSRGSSRKRSKSIYSTQIYRKRPTQSNQSRIPRDFCRYLRDDQEIERYREYDSHNSLFEMNRMDNIKKSSYDNNERKTRRNKTNKDYSEQNSLRKSMNLTRNLSSTRNSSPKSTIHCKSPRRLVGQQQRQFLHFRRNTDDSLERQCPSTEQRNDQQTKRLGEELTNQSKHCESGDSIVIDQINNNSELNQQEQLQHQQNQRSPVINNVLEELDIIPVSLGICSLRKSKKPYSPIMKLHKPIGIPPKIKASTSKVTDTTNPSKVKYFHKKKVLPKPASLVS